MRRMSRAKFLKPVENLTPRTHETEQTILDGKVSDDGREYTVDRVIGMGPDGVMVTVRNVSHKTCDFGHFQGQKVRFLAKCEKCGRVTCATEGCGFTRQRCGRAFCRRHVSVYSDGQAYCSSCRWSKHLRILYGVVKKAVK